MASIFGHAASAWAIGSFADQKKGKLKFILLCILCAIFPDADIISFQWGIPYTHMFGHRGITHSILFGFFFAAIIRSLFYSKVPFFSKRGIALFIIFSLATISHGCLDAMTSGGRGVGFFIPFSTERFFFPWRPIKVSPIGAANFFSSWGIKVIKSELLWIGIPSLIIYSIGSLMNNSRTNKNIK